MWIHCLYKAENICTLLHVYMYTDKHLENIQQTILQGETVVKFHFVFFTFLVFILQLQKIIYLTPSLIPHLLITIALSLFFPSQSNFLKELLTKFPTSYLLLNPMQPRFQPQHSPEVVHKKGTKTICRAKFNEHLPVLIVSDLSTSSDIDNWSFLLGMSSSLAFWYCSSSPLTDFSASASP